MDAHILKSMAILSLAEGTKLGYVEQPLFDLVARKVIALQARGESGTFIVPFDAVASVGTDAITVASTAATQTPSTGGAADGLLDLDALRKLKIVDQAGALLGAISRVEIDPASGAITQLAAHKGGMLGMGGATTPIDARAIVSVGPELMTVNTEASVLAASLSVDPPRGGSRSRASVPDSRPLPSRRSPKRRISAHGEGVPHRSNDHEVSYGGCCHGFGTHLLRLSRV
jgi:sporulation protein YlmC with PRC-barrel domain